MSEEIETNWLQALMDHTGYVPPEVDIHRQNFLKAEYSGFKERVAEAMLSTVATYLDAGDGEESFVTFCSGINLPEMEKVYKVYTLSKTMPIINVLVALELVGGQSEGFKAVRKGWVKVDKVQIRSPKATVSVGSMYTYHVQGKSAKAFVTHP